MWLGERVTGRASKLDGLIVHDIRIDESDDAREIIVGATDLKRWEWELEDGASNAANATTLAWASLTDRGPGWAVTETMGLHVARRDPLRRAAIAALPELLEIAWKIHDARLTLVEARAKLVGRNLRDGSEP